MKNIKIALSVLCPLLFSFTSCEKDDNGTGKSTLEVSQSVEGKIILTTPLNATQTVKEAETGVYEYEIELNKSQPVDVHIHISKLNGTADEDEDFKFDHLIVIPAYSKAGKGKIEILNDAISESQEDFTLQIGDIKTSNAFITPSIIKFSIKDCFSNLAGTYAYVTSNCYTPGPPAGNATGPFTGNVTFTATATSGEYTISDASFGGWLGLYGTQTNPVNNTANGVKLLDLCGKISYSGKDQYDEIFTFSNLVITGNKMKFHWENDYGEKGDTELTNPNGNWPALTL